MGSFSTIGGGGISKLSELIIDADKDWAGKIIKNLGAPADINDAARSIDTYCVLGLPSVRPVPNLLVAGRTMRLIQSCTWNFYNDGGYLAVQYLSAPGADPHVGHVTDEAFGDANLRCKVNVVESDGLAARLVDVNNLYVLPEIAPSATAADHDLGKFVNGVWTKLAYEAVDLSAGVYDLVGSAIGTTLKSSRNGGATFPLSVTDTRFSSGGWGFRVYSAGAWHRPVSFGSPPPPPPKCIGYYEVPITGDGSPDNPFRAALPELIEVPTATELDGYPPELANAIKANKGGAVNRLALTHGALIPTDPATGRPLYTTCIVRVFEQPDRQPHLRKIAEVLARLETQREIPVRKLDVDQAIRRAKEMDPRLSDFDLYAMPSPSDDEIRKYIEWRKATFGVETRYEDAKHYLESDKGWA